LLIDVRSGLALPEHVFLIFSSAGVMTSMTETSGICIVVAISNDWQSTFSPFIQIFKKNKNNFKHIAELCLESNDLFVRTH